MGNEELIEALAGYANDPLGFVLFNYPWGEAGTELEHYTGPQDWQATLLRQLGEGSLTMAQVIARAELQGSMIETQPLRFARTSGHGIGKSALVAWLIDWAQSTFEDTRGVVTANTENQLKTKTWAELAKWHRLGLSSELFKLTATARFSIDPKHEKTWRIDMVPWSEKNTEAFAGLHNQGKRILLVFDEASNIHDLIWETAEGAMTDKNTEIYWFCFGNPTKNSGRFRECFNGGKFQHRWDNAAISSLDVAITNKAEMNRWIEDHGLDSDFVRVRVLGQFPRMDAVSFISLDDALDAARRELPEQNHAPVVLGVDVARFGNDRSVIWPRAGLDARSRRPEIYQGLNTMQLATKVFNAYMHYHAVAVFVDVTGVGAGVYDRLLQMGVPAYAVDFGAKSDNTNPEDPHTRYANKRAEIWGAVRDFIKRGCIPEELPELEHSIPSEMSQPTYSFLRETLILLESKKDMKRRGVPSPDAVDALACTFAYPSMSDLPAHELEVAQNAEYYEDEYEYT